MVLRPVDLNVVPRRIKRPPIGAPARGIVLMLLSTIAVACMHASVRFITRELPAFEVAFFRNLFGLVALSPWFLRYGLAPLRTRRLRWHAIRGALNAVSMLAFFTGLSLTPLAKVTALSFSTPLFVTVLASVILGEVVRIRRWIAVAVGFIGMLVILRPGLIGLQLGALLILISSLLWSFAILIIKDLSKTDSSITITVYMGLFLTPLTLIPALAVWRTPEWYQLGWLLLIGILGNTGQVALTQALKYADSSALLPLDFIRLVWASVIGYLVFMEIPDGWTWLGGIIIFASASFIAWREAQLRAARPHLDGRAAAG